MTSFGREALRLGMIGFCSLTLGLGVNAFSSHPVALFRAPEPSTKWSRRMTSSELTSAWKSGRDLILLDVRGGEAYRTDPSAKALHVPAGDFPETYGKGGLGTVLRAGAGVVVMCESDRCPAADRVATMLNQLGHQPVFVLAGGWEAFRHQEGATR